MSQLSLPRKSNWMAGFLCGATSSLFAYSSSNLWSPNQFSGMAMVTAFTYILLVSLWIGWRQGAGHRTILGAGVGMSCGLAYLVLAQYDSVVRGWAGVFGEEFMSLFMTYPAILSGVIAVVMGGAKPWTMAGIFVRFWKGGFAGLFLGFSHFMLVFVFLAAGSGIHRLWGEFDSSAFPAIESALALGCASTIYFPIMSKIVGLKSEGRPAAWVAKLTVWRVGIVLFVLMTVAGIAFSNMIGR